MALSIRVECARCSAVSTVVGDTSASSYLRRMQRLRQNVELFEFLGEVVIGRMILSLCIHLLSVGNLSEKLQ